MNGFEDTILGRLERDGRLLNAVLKGPTGTPGRFGFRGDIALKFQTQVADEKRPPEYCLEQVLTYVEAGDQTIPILAGYLHNFAYIGDLSEVLGASLSPEGAYFIFCNNIDLLTKFRVTINDITFNILPCDESTVWKEMMDLAGVDKVDLKGLDTGGKLDLVLDAARSFNESFELIAYQQGVDRMGPVKNRNENRPV